MSFKTKCDCGLEFMVAENKDEINQFWVDTSRLIKHFRDYPTHIFTEIPIGSKYECTQCKIEYKLPNNNSEYSYLSNDIDGMIKHLGECNKSKFKRKDNIKLSCCDRPSRYEIEYSIGTTYLVCDHCYHKDIFQIGIKNKKEIDSNIEKLKKLRDSIPELQKFQIPKKKKTTPLKRKRGVLPQGLRHLVFKKSNFKCVQCGVSKKESSLHIDHILPLSRGGTDELDNLQILCRECNLDKSDLILEIPN